MLMGAVAAMSEPELCPSIFDHRLAYVPEELIHRCVVCGFEMAIPTAADMADEQPAKAAEELDADDR